MISFTLLPWMFHTSWYFRCNTFWSQPRYLKDCVALFGPGRQAWPNHALPLQLAKALDEDICHCKSYTLHYIADRKDQSVFYSFKPKEFVALFHTSMYLFFFFYFSHSLLPWSFPFFQAFFFISVLPRFSSYSLFCSLFLVLLCGCQAASSFIWYHLAWLKAS